MIIFQILDISPLTYSSFFLLPSFSDYSYVINKIPYFFFMGATSANHLLRNYLIPVFLLVFQQVWLETEEEGVAGSPVHTFYFLIFLSSSSLKIFFPVGSFSLPPSESSHLKIIDLLGRFLDQLRTLGVSRDQDNGGHPELIPVWHYQNRK